VSVSDIMFSRMPLALLERTPEQSVGVYFCNSCGRSLSPEEVVLCRCGVVNCDECVTLRNGLLVCKACVEY
jgi:hypothetical protein